MRYGRECIGPLLEAGVVVNAKNKVHVHHPPHTNKLVQVVVQVSLYGKIRTAGIAVARMHMANTAAADAREVRVEDSGFSVAIAMTLPIDVLDCATIASARTELGVEHRPELARGISKAPASGCGATKAYDAGGAGCA